MVGDIVFGKHKILVLILFYLTNERLAMAGSPGQILRLYVTLNTLSEIEAQLTVILVYFSENLLLFFSPQKINMVLFDHYYNHCADRLLKLYVGV